MSNPVPTVGRIVLYTLSEADAERINARRDDAIAWAKEHKLNPEHTGKQVHIGNVARAGDVYPMIIVRVWGSTPESAVNGQVLLDGNDTLWVTSAVAGVGERRFVWPSTAKPSTVGTVIVNVVPTLDDEALNGVAARIQKVVRGSI
jgi:hypothetical protein